MHPRHPPKKVHVHELRKPAHSSAGSVSCLELGEAACLQQEAFLMADLLFLFYSSLQYHGFDPSCLTRHVDMEQIAAAFDHAWSILPLPTASPLHGLTLMMKGCMQKHSGIEQARTV